MPDIIAELRDYGIEPLITDPHADASEVADEYGLQLTEAEELSQLDGLILAVNHKEFIAEAETMDERLAKNGVLIDVKSVLNPEGLREDLTYWSL